MTREEVLTAYNSDADLSGADLSGAYLSGAYLSGANLREANLRNTYLSGANLSGADLSGADLSGADLRNTDLSGADLSGADLSGAGLSGADLSGADLRNAYLSGANLSGANLSGANLSGANLRNANLRNANLSGTVLNMQCPEEGAFIAWKKCSSGVLVKLQIPEDAKRSSATSRKCRCDKASVLEIIGAYIAVSSYDSSFIYEEGGAVSVDNFEEDRFIECAPGIHFFITRKEAEEY